MVTGSEENKVNGNRGTERKPLDSVRPENQVGGRWLLSKDFEPHEICGGVWTAALLKQEQTLKVCPLA
jgi:hypothetical protein